VRRYVIDLPDGERGLAVAEAIRMAARLVRDGDGERLSLHPQSMGHAALSALLAGRVEEVGHE
jgi:hypothetical protein